MGAFEKGKESTPKVVLGIAGYNVIFGYTLIQPELLGLEIRLEAILEVAFKVGDIEALWR